MVNKIYIIPTIIFILNCSSADDVKEESKKAPIKNLPKGIYIREVKVKSDEIFDAYYKGKLIRELNESKEFNKVESYLHDSEKDFLIIDIEFKEFKNEVSHAYLLLSILTLQLYEAFGGPTERYESKMDYTIYFYNSDLKLLKKVNDKVNIHFYSHIYNENKDRKKQITYKFGYIKKTLRENL